MTDKKNEIPEKVSINSQIEHYKKLAMDNQARYSGALEKIDELEILVKEGLDVISSDVSDFETLEKQVAILKEAVEFYSDIDKQPVMDKDYVISEKHTGKKAREALKQIEEMK